MLSTSIALMANFSGGSSGSWSTRNSAGFGPPTVVWSPHGCLVPPRLEVGYDNGDDGVGVRLLWSKPPHSIDGVASLVKDPPCDKFTQLKNQPSVKCKVKGKKKKNCCLKTIQCDGPESEAPCCCWA